MKKLFLFVSVVFLFGLIGCSLTTDAPVSGEGNDDSLAKVTINIPQGISQNLQGISRNIVDAEDNSNLFEAIFYRYKADGTKYQDSFRAQATPGSAAIEMRIPVGTYDVLVLAGNQYSSTSTFTNYYTADYEGSTCYYYSWPILLASGSKENQSIVAGNNTVSITLLSVDYSLTIPSSVAQGEQYSVSAQFTLRNSFLWNRISHINVEISYSGISSFYNHSFYDETAYVQTNTAPTSVGERAIMGYTSSSGWTTYAYISPSGSYYYYWFLFGKDINPNYNSPAGLPGVFSVIEGAGVGVDLGWGDE
jgi:hypothetical protein